ncbi:MAG: NAD(P)H-hydrate dehydratase [Planctomycetes bacterium GWF2_50_10]|nr:MAG: NAD(P)H-hydrate dehydratase [Planctomycetes bacterium GWF2_50_10]
MIMDRITNIPRLMERAADSHKGTFGTVLVVGGSYGMAGAPALAASAALRSGAGLVRVAVVNDILPTVASFNPCYTTVPLGEADDGMLSARAAGAVLEAARDCDAVAIGPGLGVGAGPQEVLRGLITTAGMKIVIDADGLNNLSQMHHWPDIKKASVVVTPHPGEMKRLWTGLFREPMPDDKAQAAGLLAQRCGVVAVLKGAGSVVTDGKKYYVNETGNAGMATGGTGDVLTGVIAAMIGQKLELFEAGVLGTYVHGLAGDIAEIKYGQVSLIATDVIACLADAFKQTTTI